MATDSKPTENAVVAPVEPKKFGKVRLAFLYVLIGSLAASALVAITGLIIGEFNEVIQKALLTIFTIFMHSLLILAVVVADKHNLIGKAILPTVIGGLALVSLATTTLGTWEVISAELAWRLIGFYFFVIAVAFIVVGLLKLYVNDKLVKGLVFSSIAFTTLLTVAVIPWALDLFGDLNSLYFRIVAAIAILAVTLTIITSILRMIVVSHKPELKATTVPANPFSGGMLAIYIVAGVIGSIVATTGFTVFIVDAVQSGYPESKYETRYDSYR